MKISIIGGAIIAMGLYTVVWGKSKDYSSDPGILEPPSTINVKDSEPGQELPLTSPKGTKIVIPGANISINK